MASSSSYLGGGASNNTFTGDVTIDGNLIPGGNNTFGLGSLTSVWQDLYVGPGSIYMNGQKILEDNSGTIRFSADPNQNIAIQTSGTGDIEFTAGGLVQMKQHLQMSEGKTISAPAGHHLTIASDVDFGGRQLLNPGEPQHANSVVTRGYVDNNTMGLTGNQNIAGTKTFDGSVVITGNLTVNGSQTIINTTTIEIEDDFIGLVSQQTGTPTLNAGIQVNRGSSADVQLRWNESTDKWQVTTDGSQFQDILTSGDRANWDTAYGWGDHSAQGYLTSSDFANALYDSDLNTLSGTGVYRVQNNYTNGPAINFGTVLHLENAGDSGLQIAGHFQNADLFFRGGNAPSLGGSGVWQDWHRVWSDADFTSAHVTNWNSAYSWGNHAAVGYATNATVSGKLDSTIPSGTGSGVYQIGAEDDYLRIRMGGDGNPQGLRLDIYDSSTPFQVDRGGNMALGSVGETSPITLEMRRNSANWFRASAAGGYFGWQVNGSDVVMTLNSSGSLTVDGSISASGGNSNQWNTAYGWGDHASAGYLPLTGGVMSGLLATRTNSATDINSSNDTCFSVRGSTTVPASMSFHRSGAYAVNFGLDTDNVVKLGGWSAGTTRHSWDMSGNYRANNNIYLGGATGTPSGYRCISMRGTTTQHGGAIRCENSAGAYIGQILGYGTNLYYDSAGSHHFRNSSSNLVFSINSSGNVTMGDYLSLTSGGGWFMQDTTWTRSRNNKKVYNGSTATDAFATPGDFTAGYSDMRLKDVVSPIENVLDRVLELDCFTYTHNDTAISLGYQHGEIQVGFSAQQWQELQPEVVVDAPVNADHDTDYKTIKYDRTVPTITAALQEHVAETRRENAELRERVAKLEAMVEALLNGNTE